MPVHIIFYQSQNHDLCKEKQNKVKVPNTQHVFMTIALKPTSKYYGTIVRMTVKNWICGLSILQNNLKDNTVACQIIAHSTNKVYLQILFNKTKVLAKAILYNICIYYRCVCSSEQAVIVVQASYLKLHYV